jgi:hypothetical protein
MLGGGRGGAGVARWNTFEVRAKKKVGAGNLHADVAEHLG